MSYNFSKKPTILFLFIVFSFFGFACNTAAADDVKTKIYEGLNDAAKEGYGSDLKKQQSDAEISGMIGKALGGILSFTGIIFFALMIYGGILWMTAAGNDEQTKKATSVITAAIVGIVIVASAYAITSYVGTALTTK